MYFARRALVLSTTQEVAVRIVEGRDRGIDLASSTGAWSHDEVSVEYHEAEDSVCRVGAAH